MPFYFIYFACALATLSAVTNLNNIRITQNMESNTQLISPGVIPPLIGVYSFNTLHTVAYDIGNFFPSTAKQFNILVFMYSGDERDQSFVNTWLWTECSQHKDTKLIRTRRYWQPAYSFISNTYLLSYCRHNPILYLKSSIQDGRNTKLEIYAAGYVE